MRDEPSIEVADAAAVFRQRLGHVLAQSGESKTAFARRAGIDRTTLSQVLAGDSNRLPRADTLLQLARRLEVSLDWLLGLSEQGTIAPAVLEYAEFDARATADAQLRAWHASASGYKIRYVPTTLPDLVKTDAVLDYEFRPTSEQSVSSEREKRQQRLTYQRQPEADMEITCPMQRVVLFAEGRGVWHALSREARRAQLAQAIELVEELYPSLRWSLFDERKTIAPPFTVFGLQRVAFYVGDAYIILNSREHIRIFARRFDSLVRQAVIEPTRIAEHLRELRRRI